MMVDQKFFDELEERKGELGISDVQLSLTTLEEVFLNIAKQAELESAAADGTMVSLTLMASGETLEVKLKSTREKNLACFGWFCQCLCLLITLFCAAFPNK